MATRWRDSHHDLPYVEHDPERLRAVEFVPFRAAIEADVASLMTCHVLVPSIDEERPGTLSPKIVQGLLRDELGFEGLVFTDDMEMKAIAARWPVPARGGSGGRGRVRCRAGVQRQSRPAGRNRSRR